MKKILALLFISSLSFGSYIFNANSSSAIGSGTRLVSLTSAPGAFAISSAVAGDTTATITWGAASGATTYTLKRGTVSGTYGTTVSSNATSPYTDTGLTDGTTYYYMVVAVNSGGSTNATAEASVTPSFSPNGISGLVLWYDMQDATKYTLASTKITDITDKSSNANNATQGTDANRLTYNATAINSKPAMVNAASAGTWMTLTKQILANNETVCMVVLDTQTSPGAVLSDGNSYFWTSPQYPIDVLDGNGHEGYGGTGPTINNPYIICATWTTDANTVTGYYLNVALTGMAGSGTFNFTTGSHILGKSGVSANSFPGSIGEILIYNSVLGSTDRTNVYNYLKSRWGL